jgi:hypothetical protein
MIHFTCPKCSQVGFTAVPDGQQVLCSRCRQLLIVPLPTATLTDEPAEPKETAAITSMILGRISMVAWLLPIFGLPISITGLCLGRLSHKPGSEQLARTGIILCSIGLALSVVNSIAGAWLMSR